MENNFNVYFLVGSDQWLVRFSGRVFALEREKEAEASWWVDRPEWWRRPGRGGSVDEEDHNVLRSNFMQQYHQVPIILQEDLHSVFQSACTYKHYFTKLWYRVAGKCIIKRTNRISHFLDTLFIYRPVYYMYPEQWTYLYIYICKPVWL